MLVSLFGERVVKCDTKRRGATRLMGRTFVGMSKGLSRVRVFRASHKGRFGGRAVRRLLRAFRVRHSLDRGKYPCSGTITRTAFGVVGARFM